MKELRVPCGDAIRIAFAFDPRRVGVLLCAGRKSEKDLYRRLIQRADSLFDTHLANLRKRGKPK